MNKQEIIAAIELLEQHNEELIQYGSDEYCNPVGELPAIRRRLEQENLGRDPLLDFE